MKYFILCILFGSVVGIARAQKEDKPHWEVSKDLIVKNGIATLIEENKEFKMGIYRKGSSWKIISMLDTAGNIIKQDWFSLKNDKLDHTNTYKYDGYGNLIYRSIVGTNLNVEYNYFYRYNAKGLMDQYWTQPHTKLLYKYNEDGLIVNKLEVSPTDTSLEWNYVYENKLLVEEKHKIAALSTPFMTRYSYKNNVPVYVLTTHGRDTTTVIAYEYDLMGRVIKETETVGGDKKIINRTYNVSGQLATYELRYHREVEITEYLYDTNGLLVQTKCRYSVLPGLVEKSTFTYLKRK